MFGPYQHLDNKYFRVGQCENCRLETFQKPLKYQQSNGKRITVWKCENCEFDNRVFLPVSNDLKIYSEYIQKRYL